MKFGNPGERLRKKKWNLDELPKFEKNFYTEHPEVQRMSQVGLYLLPTRAVVPRGFNSVLFLSLFPRAVRDGRFSEKEGDHFKRLRVSQGDCGFSPGAIPSSVNPPLAFISFALCLPEA